MHVLHFAASCYAWQLQLNSKLLCGSFPSLSYCKFLWTWSGRIFLGAGGGLTFAGGAHSAPDQKIIHRSMSRGICNIKSKL